MNIRSSVQGPLSLNSVSARPQPSSAEARLVELDSFSPARKTKLGDLAEGATLLVTKLGPAAAATGAAATYAHQVGGAGLAAAALVAVPVATAGASLFLESLDFGGNPNYGGAKGLNAALIGGAGFLGGTVGAVVGASYGSALVGAAAGAVAPVAIAALAWGGFALFN